MESSSGKKTCPAELKSPVGLTTNPQIAKKAYFLRVGD
jgi:hypothetical protein